MFTLAEKGMYYLATEKCRLMRAVAGSRSVDLG
jgi:hypothetical protein